MIERHVYLRLGEGYQDSAALQEVIEMSEGLAALSMVRGLRVLRPADEGAKSAWDLCLVVSFDSLEDVEAYAVDAAHRVYVDAFLKDRVVVLKAWNFEVP